MRAVSPCSTGQSWARTYDGPVAKAEPPGPSPRAGGTPAPGRAGPHRRRPEAGSVDPLDNALLDGRYRVQSRLAGGGTSTVYRGLDTRLDRPVAVKVMDSRYAGDAQFLTRFQREARASALPTPRTPSGG